jgi:hypothetical protein
MLEGVRFRRETASIPGAAAMDLAMAGPSMTGPPWGAFSARDERVRIRVLIRDSRLISRDSSAEPSLWRLPLIRPAQEVKKSNTEKK